MLLSAIPAASSTMTVLTLPGSTSTTKKSTPTTDTTTTTASTTAATDTAATNTTTSTSSSSGGAGGGGGGGGGGVSVASSLAQLLSSYNFKVGDKSYVSSISSSSGEYTATVSGVGSVSGTSETAVENAIALRVSEMA